MTIGDVLGVSFGVVGICLSIWALLIATALLFEQRSRESQERLQEHIARAAVIGVVVALGIGGIALQVVNHPNGLLKLVGWIFLLGIVSIGVSGAGGLVLLVSQRVRQLDPRLSELGALGRGAGLMVIASLVPLLGWFAIGPVMFLASLGAGCQVIFRRARPRLMRFRRVRVAPPQTPPEGAGVLP